MRGVWKRSQIKWTSSRTEGMPNRTPIIEYGLPAVSSARWTIRSGNLIQVHDACAGLTNVTMAPGWHAGCVGQQRVPPARCSSRTDERGRPGCWSLPHGTKLRLDADGCKQWLAASPCTNPEDGLRGQVGAARQGGWDVSAVRSGHLTSNLEPESRFTAEKPLESDLEKLG